MANRKRGSERGRADSLISQVDDPGRVAREKMDSECNARDKAFVWLNDYMKNMVKDQ